jgi:hypothetical protein
MSRMAGISSGRITKAGAIIKLPGEIPYKQLFALESMSVLYYLIVIYKAILSGPTDTSL